MSLSKQTTSKPNSLATFPINIRQHIPIQSEMNWNKLECMRYERQHHILPHLIPQGSLRLLHLFNHSERSSLQRLSTGSCTDGAGASGAIWVSWRVDALDLAFVQEWVPQLLFITGSTTEGGVLRSARVRVLLPLASWFVSLVVPLVSPGLLVLRLVAQRKSLAAREFNFCALPFLDAGYV